MAVPTAPVSSPRGGGLPPAPAGPPPEEPKNYLVDSDAPQPYLEGVPVLMVVTSGGGEPCAELGFTRPVIGAAVAQRTVFSRGAVYVTDGSSKAGFIAPGPAADAHDSPRTPSAPRAANRPPPSCGFRAATAPRSSPRPTVAPPPLSQEGAAAASRPNTSPGFRGPVEKSPRVPSFRPSTGASLPSGRRPGGLRNAGAAPPPPTRTLERELSPLSAEPPEPRSPKSPVCVLVAMSSVGGPPTRSSTTPRPAVPGSLGVAGGWKPLPIAWQAGAHRPVPPPPHRNCDARKAAGLRALSSCVVPPLPLNSATTERGAESGSRSGGGPDDSIGWAASERRSESAPSSRMADFLLLPPHARVPRTVGGSPRPATCRPAGAVRQGLALRNSTLATGSGIEVRWPPADSQPQAMLRRQAGKAETSNCTATVARCDGGGGTHPQDCQDAVLPESATAPVSGSMAPPPRPRGDSGRPHGLQRMIVSALQCLFSDYCTRHFLLLADRYLGLLRSLDVLGGRAPVAAAVTEHEAVRLFHAVREPTADGLRFEDFWVVMKALAFRLARAAARACPEMTAEGSLDGDRLLWRLVGNRHRRQFLMSRVKVQTAPEEAGGPNDPDQGGAPGAAGLIAPWPT